VKLFGDARILIVGGSGGVGKTSVSAALGILSAAEGKRTLVLTIDPARRLAGALGLSGIGREAVDVTPALREADLVGEGSLHAMMLDVQNTFDRLVERYAGDPEARRRILENRLYRNLSTRLSGSQEYASMQRLHEIATEESWDRIILDTPPSTHAIDFLTAPERLSEFFDSRVVQLFSGLGGRVGWNVLRRGKDMFFGALEKLTGAGVLQEISEFFQIAEAILEPYRHGAGRAEALLRDPQTRFVVVTGPAPHQIDEAARFRAKLSELGIILGGMVVNRRLPTRVPSGTTWPSPTDAADRLIHDILAWTGRMEDMARAQHADTSRLAAATALPLVTVPVFDDDVHSIAGLGRLAAALRAPT
jgi:anion-transporting  ArsA/GET3 family ATPase